MNTEAEIEQALRRYRAGRFGPLQGVREFGLLWAVVRLRLVRPFDAQPAEHDAQIVCRHFRGCRPRNPTDCAIAVTASRSRRPQVGLRSRRLRSNAWLLEVVANPSRSMDHRDENGAVRGRIAAAPRINPSVVSQGEMWTMLMQMIPSAEAIGQGDCEASKTIGARTLVTRVAFAHAMTPAARPALDRKVGRRDAESLWQNERRARPSRSRFRG